MAKPSLGRKTLSVFMAFTMAISLNVPAAAWANDAAGNADAATEQPQENLASGGGSQDLASDGANSQVAGVATQAGESETPAASSEEGTNDSLVVVNGDNAIAQVGDKGYDSLQSAIDDADNEAMVLLVANANESVVVPADKNLTLDLNGKKLTNAGGKHTITNNGVLTIQDSSEAETGTVDNVSHGKAAVENNQGATCNILSGVFSRSREAGSSSTDSGKNSYYYLENFGAMTIGAENGAIDSVKVESNGKFSSLVHNGWYDGSKNAAGVVASMTINAGTFKGGVNTIKNDDYGELAINNGSFENASQHPVFNVNVATINGGTFESSADVAIYTCAYDSVMDKGITTVTGGTFKSPNGKSNFRTANSGAAPRLSVSGGTYSADLKAEWLAERCGVNRTVDGSDKTFAVVKNVDAQLLDEDGESVSTVRSGYGNFYDLSKTMMNGQTLKLLCDIDKEYESVTCPANTRIIFDLNGHSFKSLSYWFGSYYAAVDLRNEGSQITVKNGSLESKYMEAVSVLAENCKVTLENVNMISNYEGDDYDSYSRYGIATNGSASGSQWSSAGLQLKLVNCSLTTNLEDCGCIGVYFPVRDSVKQEAKLEIENSQIIGFNTGVQVCSGVAKISGSKTSISAVGEPTENDSNDGPRFDGAAVSIIDRAGYGALKGVTIDGGNFSVASKDARAVHAFKLNGSSVSEFDNSDNRVSVTGGIFDTDVAGYVADGYESVKTSDAKYTVAKKGEESKSEEGNTTGSVSVNGEDIAVSADDQKEIAKSAEKLAGSLKANGATIDESSNTATVGDVTLDTSAQGAAEAIQDVGAKAQSDETSSVDVKFVVKANTDAEANDDIASKAEGTNAYVIPFTLSVDMVTEVKNANDEVIASAAVPVKEVKEPIRVTIKVDPASLKDGDTELTVVVARKHGDVVETFKPVSVNYETGEITFETEKFSDYAVLVSNPAGGYKLESFTTVGEDGTVSRSQINNADFGQGNDVVFAGWYTNPELTIPCASDATTGTVYPKFVPVSELITFKGGSLRMDGNDPANFTNLRFGYETRVPAGATRGDWYWTWSAPDANVVPARADVKNYVLNENGSAKANLVLTEIHTRNYKVDVKVAETICYTTKDGTYVEATEPILNSRSVYDVAKLIDSYGMASSAEKQYATAIISAADGINE